MSDVDAAARWTADVILGGCRNRTAGPVVSTILTWRRAFTRLDPGCLTWSVAILNDGFRRDRRPSRFCDPRHRIAESNGRNGAADAAEIC